jgi:hypothetical protein
LKLKEIWAIQIRLQMLEKIRVLALKNSNSLKIYLPTRESKPEGW